MNMVQIVWTIDSGNMVPPFGIPVKGQTLTLDKKRAELLVKSKMAKYTKQTGRTKQEVK